MAYTFDNTDDRVEFSIAPFNGYTFGALTFAAFVKRAATGGNDCLLSFNSAAGTANLLNWLMNNSDFLRFNQVLHGGASSSQTVANTSLWYLLAVTKPAGSTLPRFHVHDGTSWVHANAPSGAAGDSAAIAGTDRLRVGISGTTNFMGSDLACIGIKKSDSSDATIETLSRTSWAAWVAYGFEWLIGFEASGTLNDLGTAGTGDETARTGTTLTTDPPSWSWTLGPPPSTFVPQVVIINA